MRVFALFATVALALQATAMSAFDDSAAQAALANAEAWIGKHLYTTADEAAGDAGAILESDITYEPLRIVRNRGFTEDLVFGRLNIKLDENKVITRVWIG
ncbi:hypothetical protein SDRG_07276 [Saprolegnia diclina VS20]|uniref:PepSY domain-containing protein n=1 Tax=Saprolegnia diclina (strain VS20) TaxID=1156394 RepID=T0QK09_SAPDV|nr:hypothetical protein SDRG_07276 [Saprolegnia diclina VS20]EQC35036.1 hypothetical protein SDRG_07276 [Saprolegnia diclina VS20]|eukprot:XP_008611320.1 hypothetical protein SDRG_07276 [Saprolegnia diclina VS20]